jgi:hypothetical protein
MSTFKVVSPASAAPILVHRGPVVVDEVFLTNLKGTVRYLKCWDAANASDVTVGTTPPDLIIPVQPSGAISPFVNADLDAVFALGLVVVVVTGLPDNDATAPTARDIVGTLNYCLPGRE